MLEGAPRRLGYACICLGLPDSSPRGTVLRNATPERLRELTAENLRRLAGVLRFNAEHGIRLFRISSDVVPFGSHPANQLAWWHEHAAQLSEVGALVRGTDARVSMHPGQYSVLSSPDPGVVARSVDDLVYHARFLDALGLDGSHKLILHVGGAYGDKPSAIERWAANVRALPPNVRARLVVENDERLFGAKDALAAAQMGGVPMVLDVLHHRVYSGDGHDLPDLLARAFATWDANRDGVPKIHYSTQAAGRRSGAHADHVDADEFRDFLRLVPPRAVYDCMLEAKAKDLALLRLREETGLRV